MTGQVRNKSKTGLGVLTDAQVREIRESRDLYYSNMPKNIAKKYGVTRQVISSVWQDRTYNHVI